MYPQCYEQIRHKFSHEIRQYQTHRFFIQGICRFQHSHAVRLGQHGINNEELRLRLAQKLDGVQAVIRRTDNSVPVGLLEHSGQILRIGLAAVCKQDTIHFFHTFSFLLLELRILQNR